MWLQNLRSTSSFQDIHICKFGFILKKMTFLVIFMAVLKNHQSFIKILRHRKVLFFPFKIHFELIITLNIENFLL